MQEVQASSLFAVFDSTLLLLCVKCKHIRMAFGVFQAHNILVMLPSRQGHLVLLGRSYQRQ